MNQKENCKESVNSFLNENENVPLRKHGLKLKQYLELPVLKIDSEEILQITL